MIEAFDIPELLPKLVDRSLVTYDEDTGRYSLLETVRQYAAEHEVNSGESASLRDKHLEYFLDLSRGARQKVRGPEQLYWLPRFDSEYDNIRLALDWALASPATYDKGIDLAYELLDYWIIRSSFQESHQLMERIRAVIDDKPINRCRLQLMESSIGYFTTKPNSELALEAIALAKEVGDDVLIGDALSSGILDLLMDGRYAESQALKESALAALAKVGDHVMTAFVHINFGNHAFMDGRIDEAEHHYKECLRVRKSARDLRGSGAALGSLGHVCEERGDFEEAKKLYRQGLSAFATVSSSWDLAGGLCSIGLEFSENGRWQDLAKVLGFADALLKKVGGQRDKVDGRRYNLWSQRATKMLGKEEFDKNRLLGARMSLAEILDLIFPNGLEVPSLEDEPSTSEV